MFTLLLLIAAVSAEKYMFVLNGYRNYPIELVCPEDSVDWIKPTSDTTGYIKEDNKLIIHGAEGHEGMYVCFASIKRQHIFYVYVLPEINGAVTNKIEKIEKIDNVENGYPFLLDYEKWDFKLNKTYDLVLKEYDRDEDEERDYDGILLKFNPSSFKVTYSGTCRDVRFNRP